MPCFAACRFELCPDSSPFPVGASPDVAFTSPICSSTISVGHVDATGEAYVVSDGRQTKISKYGPDGLLQPFSPSFFKSFSADGEKYPGDLSGVGHEVPQRNQADYLEGMCVALPLRSYQVLNGEGGVVENVHPVDDLVDCVSFEVKLGEMPIVEYEPAAEKPMSESGGDKREPAEVTGAPETEVPVYTPAPIYTSMPATAAPVETEAPVYTEKQVGTEMPVYTEATTMAPVLDEVTTMAPVYTEAPTNMPVYTEAPTEAPSYTEATTIAQAYTEAMTAEPVYTEATTTASAYTEASTRAPTTATYVPPPMSEEPSITCEMGCPMPRSVSPIYSKCVGALGDRPIKDYWIFAAANGVTAAGKKCGTADADGVQLCAGIMTEVEYCDAGFSCVDSSENYRPQIVKCVSGDGEICRLSDEQRDNIILERVSEGTDFFIACAK